MRKNRRRDDINADECAECAHECAEYSEFAELMLVLSRKVNSAIMVIVVLTLTLKNKFGK